MGEAPFESCSAKVGEVGGVVGEWRESPMLMQHRGFLEEMEEKFPSHTWGAHVAF